MNIFEATATNTLLDWLTGSEPPVTAEQAGDAAVTLANQANKALLSGVTAPAVRDLWAVVAARVGPVSDTDPGLPLSALFDNQPTEPIQAGSCHACRQPIDHTELHTTITRQIEHQVNGQHWVIDSWLVAEYHEHCAPAAGR